MPASEQILAVFIVLGLLGGAVLFARHRQWLPLLAGASRPVQAAFRVTHRIPLTAQHCLHVVEAGGAVLLIGTHPAGIVFAPQTSAFEQDLRRAVDSRNGSGQ
jgi:hypothetical protein